ncbi:MAG: ribosome maturation factor RimM [Alphaproteobacteria bacterium]|nr:ribosome maturation factor RimM [Alphaproteobacteria bacterium]
MAESNKILVGKIVGAQGLRGEIRVHTYTESPADFRDLKFADIDLQFVRALPNSPVIIAKVNGVNDRNAADSLRGTELFIGRDALPALLDGEFYYTDLIGMKVGDNKVVDIHNFGAGDILELENGEMISFADAKVDFGKKTITFK